MKDEFVNELFDKNINILQEVMDKQNLSKKQITSNLVTILNNLDKNIYVNQGGKLFQIQDINEFLVIKLGYYKLLNSKILETYVKQCTLIPTSKGNFIHFQYKIFTSDELMNEQKNRLSLVF